jgi:hypothetical protein
LAIASPWADGIEAVNAMNEGAGQLELLRQKIASLHAKVVAARESLIEATGDHMCGGDCPSPQLLEAYDEALQAEARAKAVLQRYLAKASRQTIEWVNRNSKQAPKAAAGC